MPNVSLNGDNYFNTNLKEICNTVTAKHNNSVSEKKRDTWLTREKSYYDTIRNKQKITPQEEYLNHCSVGIYCVTGSCSNGTCISSSSYSSGGRGSPC